LKRKKRLNRSDDIQRVRQRGRSFSHPMVVLTTLMDPNIGESKIGIIATKSVGGAVSRNRSKRLIRAAIEPYTDQIKPNYHLVLIARKPILEADIENVSKAVYSLLKKAEVLLPSSQ